LAWFWTTPELSATTAWMTADNAANGNDPQRQTIDSVPGLVALDPRALRLDSLNPAALFMAPIATTG
jgi:hypothetical protein